MDKKLEANIPIYIQIMNKVRKAVASGELKPGDRIGSVRELASEFEVNPNTIQRSLTELEREGLLVSERTAGRFVTENRAQIEELRSTQAEAAASEFREAMNELGYDACGIDLCPQGADVIKGDFLNTGFSPESFDGVLSQCAFYVSGDVEAAVGEAVRLLKPGGWFLFSDVWFGTEEALRQMLERKGLCINSIEDHSEEWKEYYIEAIWNGTMEAVPKGTGRCRYYSVTAGKYGKAP